MPIRPPSRLFRCPACGWSKTVIPRSDALGPGDYYNACTQCHHSPLESQPVGALEGEVAQAIHTIARLWKSR